MSRNFNFFEHESDIGVKIEADSLEELFISAAEALFSLIANKNSRGEEVSFTREITGDTQEDLLVSWLNELIFVFEKDGSYCKGFCLKISGGQSAENTECFLNADVSGEKIDWDKDEILHEVKAATYHQLKIIKEEGKHKVKIIFDV